jgi:hypothetical protein
MRVPFSRWDGDIFDDDAVHATLRIVLTRAADHHRAIRSWG